MAVYEQAQLKDYSTDVRALDLESSKKIAQSGDYATGVMNYTATLNTQLKNGSLSETDYKIATIEGKSAIAEAHIMGLMQTDPVSAQIVLNTLKTDSLTAQAVERLEKAVKPGAIRKQGNTVGTEIFKADTTGSLEKMTDELRSRNLAPEIEEHAEAQIKDLYTQRKTDEVHTEKVAIDKVNAKLAEITLKSRGIAKQSDLTSGEWAELTRDAPKYAATLQDSMRREADILVKEARAESRAARSLALQERQVFKMEQDENEEKIMISDDFTTRDLKSDLATGKIRAGQYRQLLELQTKMDPLKRDSVKTALKRVTEGTDLGRSLGGIGSSEDAIWKQKYGNLVKAFAYKYADDPAFDTKLTEFVEKNILSELSTSWFSKDATDRQTKFEKAREIAGELPQRRATDKKSDPLREQAITILNTNKKPLTEANIDYVKKQIGSK
jgi:hypothetical protein